jgi:hypothetical protein
MRFSACLIMIFSTYIFAFDPAYILDNEKRDIMDSSIRLAQYFNTYSPICSNYITSSNDSMCVECYKGTNCEGLSKSTFYLLAPSRGLKSWNYTGSCECYDVTHLFVL